ncbi:MAG TPA: hypothetical protein VK875_09045 [Euzebyales bacterium]|nr:hypothetical protein [Euzebyales bacterium]
MGHNRRRMSWLLGVLAMTLIAAACGSSGAASVEEPPATSSSDGREIIRFAFAPDPVWDYMRDTGVLTEWEKKNNLRIVTSESWDEFAYFAGGHGDIVSMATHELPVLEEESGTKVVAFGKYNHDRISLMRNADDRFETLADLPEGSRPCVGSAVSTTIVWSVIADQFHDIDYRVGQGEFDVVVQDYFEMPDMVAQGECTVAATLPEAAVAPLREGSLEIMYGGRAPWQIYQDICECDHKGIMSNLFVATEEWYDSHPEQAAAFLELWERGVELWHQNKEEIVGLYPQHFSVETEDEIKWMVDYMEGPQDWFVETVYLDEAWVEGEKELYEYMTDAGWMAEDTEIPRFEVITP